MKNLLSLTLILVLFSSCDPVAQMEAYIENSSTEELTIIFASSDTSFYQELKVKPEQKELCQDWYDIGSTYLEPELSYYDSIYIKDMEGNILKVYKENTEGKNIYNVPDDWQATKKSRWTYEFLYSIEEEEIN
ncbi:MAG: hypothetical protein R3321_11110 [Nitrososphaeraceae archaeon]|nr:hypothetical protein [Nitrososphaeraceae archaeon]